MPLVNQTNQTVECYVLLFGAKHAKYDYRWFNLKSNMGNININFSLNLLYFNKLELFLVGERLLEKVFLIENWKKSARQFFINFLCVLVFVRNSCLAIFLLNFEIQSITKPFRICIEIWIFPSSISDCSARYVCVYCARWFCIRILSFSFNLSGSA